MSDTALIEVPPQPKAKRRTTFQIADDMLALWDIIADLEGDISDPVHAEFVENTLAELTAEANAKLNGIGFLVRECELREKGLKEAAADFRAKAEVESNSIKRLKEIVRLFLDTQRDGKFTASQFKFWVQANGGKTPVVMAEIDPYGLPERFQTVTVTANTDAIREALEAGEELPWASLGQKGSHVRIK